MAAPRDTGRMLLVMLDWQHIAPFRHPDGAAGSSADVGPRTGYGWLAARKVQSDTHRSDIAGIGEGLVAEANVRVETVELDSSGTRQIRQRSRTTALLRDRADDIESAVQEASEIVQGSVAKVQNKDGWLVKSVEVKFGLVLTAEAGVVLSRASAEASFEVTLTIERG